MLLDTPVTRRRRLKSSKTLLSRAMVGRRKEKRKREIGNQRNKKSRSYFLVLSPFVIECFGPISQSHENLFDASFSFPFAFPSSFSLPQFFPSIPTPFPLSPFVYFSVSPFISALSPLLFSSTSAAAAASPLFPPFSIFHFPSLFPFLPPSILLLSTRPSLLRYSHQALKHLNPYPSLVSHCYHILQSSPSSSYATEKQCN